MKVIINQILIENQQNGHFHLPHTGSSLDCALGCDAGGHEFETPTGPALRVFKITEEKVLPF